MKNTFNDEDSAVILATPLSWPIVLAWASWFCRNKAAFEPQMLLQLQWAFSRRILSLMPIRFMHSPIVPIMLDLLMNV